VSTMDDYLRLLPKVELHCHFVSTMPATLLVAHVHVTAASSLSRVSATPEN
jgi:hypothetical protein